MRGRRHKYFFCHTDSGSAPSCGCRCHRNIGREAPRGSSVAMAVLHKGRQWLQSFLRGRTRATSLKILFTYRIAPAGFVTALSNHEGAVTRPAAPGFNPARPSTTVLAGECPLYARAIVILFLAADGKRGNSPCLLPPASVHKPAHPDVHHNAQRQKHEQDGRPAITH